MVADSQTAEEQRLWKIFVEAYAEEREKHYLGYQEYDDDAEAKGEMAGVLAVAQACRSETATSRDAVLDEAASHLEALVDSGSAPITYAHAARSIVTLKNAAPQENKAESREKQTLTDAPGPAESASSSRCVAVPPEAVRWAERMKHHFVEPDTRAAADFILRQSERPLP